MDWTLTIEIAALIAMGDWLRSRSFPAPEYLAFGAMMTSRLSVRTPQP